ncbi:signal peptide peptidase SppA [Pseudodesulfovibrio sp. F-1]|uniref:Signal peptide peptidase SppA n=1 Tax=Pseudodesulfovibrio alkaliphilus TaxID=2661613 RepID=A0A7K1KNZ0_9BACT|nr:signal peptide peptidase SppA [Pseudodesulfovibrio alkaliphilus]MUM77799.1 signal peptide peptidase SppA [Pseudodesulfovibrio alkaliphilus]
MRRTSSPAVPALLAALALFLVLPGCAPKLKIFAAPTTDPLKEFVLEGSAADKLALVHLTGFLTVQPRQGVLRATPSQVQELVSALALAEADPQVRAVVLAIDSPGGTATTSDILYHEIAGFRERTGKAVVAAMLDVAASGGYYAALPADWILAHPTTITGSVGVVFMRPKLHGLLDKIGVDVEVSKSGADKDMGSPFRPTSPEEAALFQAIIDDYADRFLSLVARHRSLTDRNMELARTARIFTARQALDAGLIDEVGYIQDAFAKARALAGLPEGARVVTYRRDTYPNDNPYNTMTAADPESASLLGLDAGFIMPPRAGFHYVWPQGMTR